MVADVVEALLGTIYLEAGWAAAQRVCHAGLEHRTSRLEPRLTGLLLTRLSLGLDSSSTISSCDRYLVRSEQCAVSSKW